MAAHSRILPICVSVQGEILSMLWGLLSITPAGPGIDFESCMRRGSISQLTISGAYKQTEKEITGEGGEVGGQAKTKSV